MKKLDFTQLESLRRHMLMSVSDISNFLGVSRETWYTWQKGGYPRKGKEAFVRERIRELLHVMSTYSWPTPDVIASDPKDRYTKLVQTIKEQK